MDPQQTGNVPGDCWVCGVCNAINVIDVESEICPVCEHMWCEEEGCCIGPNQPCPAGIIYGNREHSGSSHGQCQAGSGPANLGDHYNLAPPRMNHASNGGQPPNHRLPDQPDDTWYCSGCGGLNQDWYDACPVCGAARSYAQFAAPRQPSLPLASLSPNDGPAPGAWICESCGAANSDLTPDFCPVCGAART